MAAEEKNTSHDKPMTVPNAPCQTFGNVQFAAFLSARFGMPALKGHRLS